MLLVYLCEVPEQKSLLCQLANEVVRQGRLCGSVQDEVHKHTPTHIIITALNIRFPILDTN